MANTLQIYFDRPINISLQVGDNVYGASTQSQAGHNVAHVGSDTENPYIYIGICAGVENDHIKIYPTNPDIIDGNGFPILPDVVDYIMFTKDHVVNTSNLKGYFAEVELKNNSKEKAELFSIGMEVTQSSK